MKHTSNCPCELCVTNRVSADNAPATDPAQAQKKDAGKAPMWRGLMAYFAHALHAIALVSLFGYKKYGSWGGWINVPDALSRYEDALLRHTAAMACGEVIDPESGLHHAAHRAWCALAVLELTGRAHDKTAKE